MSWNPGPTMAYVSRQSDGSYLSRDGSVLIFPYCGAWVLEHEDLSTTHLTLTDARVAARRLIFKNVTEMSPEMGQVGAETGETSRCENRNPCGEDGMNAGHVEPGGGGAGRVSHAQDTSIDHLTTEQRGRTHPAVSAPTATTTRGAA